MLLIFSLLLYLAQALVWGQPFRKQDDEDKWLFFSVELDRRQMDEFDVHLGLGHNYVGHTYVGHNY